MLSLSYTQAMGRLSIAVFALALAAGAQPADPVSETAERERAAALVEAGALPRTALANLERDLEKQRLRDDLRALSAKAVLTVEEIPRLLEAAARLRQMAGEDLGLVRQRVDAGALPRKDLAPAAEADEAASKTYELVAERVRLARELAKMASAETLLEELEEEELAFRFLGSGGFDEQDILDVESLFFQTFRMAFPVSADGDTELHRSLGLDHTGRIDIALHPDSDEGRFLLDVLESWSIPFIAFRAAVPGQATGPHIHIGLPSPPLAVDEDVD